MKTGKKGAIVIAFALMALIARTARPQIVFAQNPPTPIRGSWEGLKAIPSGDKVEVTLRNGQTLKGRLVSVSDTLLTIEKGKNAIDVTRADALKVYRGLRKSTTRATMLGLGIGAGSGAVAGAITAGAVGGGEDSGLFVLIMGGAGAIAGTLSGLLIGISSKKRELIYETR
jgi:hypothetical protein